MGATKNEELLEPVRAQSHELNDSGLKHPELSPPQDVVSVEDVPPNGGYGWVCTACVFMLTAYSWGLNSISHPQRTSLLQKLNP